MHIQGNHVQETPSLPLVAGYEHAYARIASCRRGLPWREVNLGAYPFASSGSGGIWSGGGCFSAGAPFAAASSGWGRYLCRHRGSCRRGYGRVRVSKSLLYGTSVQIKERWVEESLDRHGRLRGCKNHPPLYRLASRLGWRMLAEHLEAILLFNRERV